MNDPGECRVAEDVVLDALLRLCAEDRLGLRHDWLEAMFRHASNTFDESEIFLTSFAIDGDAFGRNDLGAADSLSQWAMYGEDAEGVALVFEVVAAPPVLLRVADLHGNDADVRTTWSPVSFAHEIAPIFEQVRYADDDGLKHDLVTLVREFCARDYSDSNLISSAMAAFSVVRSSIKSPFYSQEYEGRLTAHVHRSVINSTQLSQRKPFKFTDDGRPYLEFPWGQTLKLVAFVLGPRRTKDERVATEIYLGQAGVQVDVLLSKGSYRRRQGAG
jgi:hypothetical protein